ncbi:thermonuclease family protein [Williamsia sp. DF01-3]|uniref:thermonuclease family protein n=1 Tax=Williamsia sp. DF01-3 TaxID=2934157 RepID=UPI000DB6AACC|nr:thermonuclease family protein [Williamsia sp. DF01-3]MCK0515779.1 thermonuclease family protein [Williamsia sp. DF01-3]PZU01996.1 MAG: nuclease [Gordonia sp. (in: high G+C Gram-positive bacteria)]
MNSRHRALIAATLIAATLLGGCASVANEDVASVTDTAVDVMRGQIPDTAGPEVTVTRVVDGDTIEVEGPDGATSTVRLIGVDTPETVKPNAPVECFGPQASEYTSTILTGRAVRLEHDQTVGDTDRYDRTLAYVWTVQDRRLFNLALIEAGAAREYTYDRTRYRYRNAFRAAQTDAQRDRHGLWGHCPTDS